jgi:hypothetical protein
MSRRLEMKTKLLAPLFILLIICACCSLELPEGPESYDITFRIKGTVTDATNNSPVQSASVNLCVGSTCKKTAYSDDKGQYNISVILNWSNEWEESDLYLWIIATGYKDKEITYDDEKHVRLTDRLQIIDVQLEPDSGEVISRRNFK